MPSAPFLPPLLSPASSSSQEPKLCFLGMTHACLPPALPASQIFISKGRSVSRSLYSEDSGDVRQPGVLPAGSLRQRGLGLAWRFPAAWRLAAMDKIQPPSGPNTDLGWFLCLAGRQS